jgi:phosphatidylinositol glycan class S
LHAVFSSFASQLSSLLGIPALPDDVKSVDSGVSDWQLDTLTRRRTLENAEGSRDTLLSIVKLVDQIANMPVGPDVRDDVEGALSALHKVRLYTVYPSNCTRF